MLECPARCNWGGVLSEPYRASALPLTEVTRVAQSVQPVRTQAGVAMKGRLEAEGRGTVEEPPTDGFS